MEIDPLHTIAAVVGFAAMFFLWLAVLMGLALARGWIMTRIKHSTLFAVHGGLATMGLTLGVVHGLAQLAPADTTIKFVDVVVPFTHIYDPVGIGAGVLALELMIALAASLAFKRWLGFHRWRALHSLAYAAYTLMTGHVLISGAETGGWVVTALVLAPWLIAIGLWLGGSSKPGMPRLADKLTTRMRGSLTTVQVDPVQCARFGFCEQEAPEVFTLRGDGQLAYHTVVADQHVDAAIRAVRACPARAIALSQGSSSRRIAVPARNGRG